MALIPPTLVAGQPVDVATLNTWFAQLAALLNGGLTTANMSASAGVLQSQMAGAYEHMNLTLNVTVLQDAAALQTNWGTKVWTAWPATTYLAYVPLYGTTGDTGGDWTVTEVDWHCSNTGGGTGTWALRHVGYTGNPAALTVIGADVSTGTITDGAGASNLNSVANVGLSRALTRQAYPTMLALYAVGADATTMNAVGNFFTMSIGMRRLIAAV